MKFRKSHLYKKHLLFLFYTFISFHLFYIPNPSNPPLLKKQYNCVSFLINLSVYRKSIFFHVNYFSAYLIKRKTQFIH